MNIFYKLFNKIIYDDLDFDYGNHVVDGIQFCTIFINNKDCFEKVKQLIKELEVPENA